MDKRSLLFIFAITFSFFFLNQWFFTSPTQESPKQEQKVIVEKDRMVDKRISFDDLSPVSLYSDPEGNDLVSFATRANNHYLLLAWSLELPKKLYVKNGTEIETVELVYKNTHIQEPVIYTTSTNPKIQAPSLSSFQALDFQFADFSKTPQSARVTHGSYQNGRLTFPKSPVLFDTIVLFQSADGYVPVGVFDAKAQKIRFLQDFLKFKEIVQVAEKIATDTTDRMEETRYVLENQYQQLVFSSRGGALAEINLPFHSTNNRLSVVKPIGLDKAIKKSSPRNDYFPSFQHYGPAPRDEGLSLHPHGKVGGYYPLIRRSLLDNEGNVVADIPPEYYALNIISEDYDTANLQYKLVKYEDNMIQFEATQPHRRITRTYRLPNENTGGPYCFDVEIRIEGDQKGLWLSSGVPEVELMSGSYMPNLRIQLTKNNKPVIEELSLPKDETISHSVQPDWLSNSNGFFGIITDGLSNMPPGYKVKQISGNIVPTRLTLIDPQFNLYPAHKYPGYTSYLPLNFSPGDIKFRVFAGPYEEKILNLVDEVYSNPVTGYKSNYISAQSIQGWFSFISEPFAKFLYFIMKFFHFVTGSWGLSIILLTIVLKLMLYPLNNWSIKSSLKMQAVGPQVKALQEKHKKDPRKAQAEVMSLYREKGVNPFMGCFPMLIQMPFLFGMFYLLKSSFSLRGAAFIPGWINNLAAPDVLFSWNYPVFFVGTQFHLLPILLGATMYWQQKVTAKLPADPSQLTDQQKQQKMMGNIMAIVFTLIFYSFPSGLNLYFLSSNLLGILQQWYVNRRMKSPVHITTKK